MLQNLHYSDDSDHPADPYILEKLSVGALATHIMSSKHFNISYMVQGLRTGYALCQWQLIHKPSKQKLSILLDSHCLDKIRGAFEKYLAWHYNSTMR